MQLPEGRTALIGFDGGLQRFLQLWNSLDAGTHEIAIEPRTSGHPENGQKDQRRVDVPAARCEACLEISCTCSGE